LTNEASLLSEAVGKPAREKALAALLSTRLQKRSLRKRSPSAGSSTSADADTAGDLEMVGATASGSTSDDEQIDDIETGEAETGTEAGSVADEIHDIEASDCELVPECSICMESFTNPVVCLLKL
jgi:hypothetical protein